jgi:TetR/AcrR family transcriptional regulator, transcriptional repressor of aconitase
MAARTGSGRAALIDAAYECIAVFGYARATTARICERAGVSSGTFFHFFPTKADLLMAVLTAGDEQAARRAAELASSARTDALGALDTWIDELLDDAQDKHFSGFIAAIGALPDDHRVREALQEGSQRTLDLLTEVITAGQESGQIPVAQPADTLAVWLDIAANGFQARVAEDPAFSARDNAALLRDMVARLLH